MKRDLTTLILTLLVAALAASPVTAQCTTAPTFAGITAVTQLPDDVCGLRVEWTAGTNNCSNEPLVYNVYRSATPGFSPGPSNLRAACVTNTFWDDTAVTGLTDYHYIVRAEDNSDGVGRCRGGNEDANIAFLIGEAVTLTPTTLYDNDFETGTGLDDWTTFNFNGAGGSMLWLGIQSCFAASGSNIFRYGATGCTSNYGTNRFQGSGPLPGGTGIVVPVNTRNVTLDFNHRWNLEPGFDGVTLALSVNGTNYTPLPASVITGGTTYNDTLANACPPVGGIAGLPTFSDVSPGYPTDFESTTVDLDAACDVTTGGTGGCDGQNLFLAFTTITDCTVNDDGWFLDDVVVSADSESLCTFGPQPVDFLTATATNGQNEIEWVNPSVGAYGSTRIVFRTDRFPTSATDGTVVATVTGTAGLPDSTIHSGLTNGTTYFYSAFVDNGGGLFGARRTVQSRPFDSSIGQVRWSYATGATALTPPSIGSVYAVSNDRTFHSMTAGTAGGDWPGGWSPQAMNGPAQSRPPILPVAVGGATKTALIGSQDGRVYAVNADTGTIEWTSPQIADTVQSAPAAMLTAFGGSVDLVFTGTRNGATANALVALNLADGSEAWRFDNGGSGLGVISGGPTVRYNNDRLYFASREDSPGDATVWCITFDGAGATLVWSAAIGDIDGSLFTDGAKVYVGTNAGELVALDADTGAVEWTFVTGDGPVKGFPWPRFIGTRELFFSTTNTVWSITDDDTSATLNWSTAAVPSPSTPLGSLSDPYVWVGSSDGRIYQLSRTTGMVDASLVLGDGTATVGSPAFSISDSIGYIGTEAGVVYAVELPLP
ncbi:MAG: PQQ-binding-like beta-propeller repeat protein [Acidobacteriota bacterium]